MKKFIFSMTCVACIGAFIFSPKMPKESTDLTMENIEVVGLSASETECDPINTNPCAIYRDGKVVGTGTGKSIHWD